MVNDYVLWFQVSFEITVLIGIVVAIILEHRYALKKQTLNGGHKVRYYVNANMSLFLVHTFVFTVVLLTFRFLGYHGPSVSWTIWSELLHVHAIVFIASDRIVKLWMLNLK